MIALTRPAILEFGGPSSGHPFALPCAALVVFVPAIASGSSNDAWPEPLRAMDDMLGGQLAMLAGDGEFTGQPGEVTLLHTRNATGARRIAFAGVGDPQTADADRFRRAAAVATRRLRAASVHEFSVLLPHDGSLAQAIAEGLLLADYRFTHYLADKGKASRITLVVAPASATSQQDSLQAVEAGIARGRAVGEATVFARDLCNHPGNVLTPRVFADVAIELAREHGMRVEVFDEEALSGMNMGGLIGVAAGSREPPRLVVLEYSPGDCKSEPPVVLVGKTVTFDSGGISLKAHLDMDHMKADMTGGAAVLGALRAAARLGLQQRIVGIFAVVENMPGGGATRPGDILHMASGTTVEVLNTDAEGRLILADALHHARSYGPQCVIDVATLTGASAMVFGPVFTGMFSTSQTHAQAMQVAGQFCGEPVWPMPLAAEYRDMLKGTVADLRNIAGPLGAMPIAAAFLQHFTDGLPWLHLDIYNTCWNTTDHPLLPVGPTGSGTRLLTQFLIDHARRPAASAS
ncbi:leucyl aminopeptidase [Variovorax sp. VNK109]|uniref:leucyl aminopeptidase n=1 Tax=Variovorax sp. VNK109 TaxID=3400919 RepID=UPI003C0B643C